MLKKARTFGNVRAEFTLVKNEDMGIILESRKAIFEWANLLMSNNKKDDVAYCVEP